MNRRAFLAGLAATMSAAVYDPERALWTPGKKLISIPQPKPIAVGDIVTIGPFADEWVVIKIRPSQREGELPVSFDLALVASRLHRW